MQGPAGRHVHGIETAPKPPPRIEDNAEWERVMRADLAVRDAAREPYLAPTRSPLRISRFVADGGDVVARHLAASVLAGRPELIYRVYRGLPAAHSVSLVCARDAVVNPDYSRRAARERLGVASVELDAGHFPMLTAPDALADALSSVV